MKAMHVDRRNFAALIAVLALTVVTAGCATAAPEKGVPPGKEAATFAAGCFWSMEAIFKQLRGVEKAEPGYSGGKVANPSYEQVETGTTGHAESLNIIFDPKVISYRDLLEVLLTVRDPTTLNRQGNDEGPQYRSIIFYRNEEQKKIAREMIAKFTSMKVYSRPIVTEIQPYAAFYRAEDYHLDYFRLHPNQPYCKFVVAPEVKEFQQKFKAKLKK